MAKAKKQIPEKGKGEVGYKKPPRNRQFGQPEGNPQGVTSAQRKMEIENAERATRLRGRLLQALEGVMNEHPKKERIVDDHIKADVLRLLKEAEDRGLGTPKQSISHGNDPDNPMPTQIILRAADDASDG